MIYFNDAHRFMISVEHQSNNIFFGHFGELTCEDVLEINEIFHIFMGSIISDDFEIN